MLRTQLPHLRLTDGEGSLRRVGGALMGICSLFQLEQPGRRLAFNLNAMSYVALQAEK